RLYASARSGDIVAVGSKFAGSLADENDWSAVSQSNAYALLRSSAGLRNGTALATMSLDAGVGYSKPAVAMQRSVSRYSALVMTARSSPVSRSAPAAGSKPSSGSNVPAADSMGTAVPSWSAGSAPPPDPPLQPAPRTRSAPTARTRR